MKKVLSFIATLAILLTIPLGITTKTEANWTSECLPGNTVGQECMFSDVYQYPAVGWQNDLATYEGGQIAKFSLDYWNHTSSAKANVNFRITLPAGMTFVPNQLTAYVNGVAIAQPSDSIFSSSGWNYPTNFPKQSYINIYARVNVPINYTTGVHDFTEVGRVTTGSGFNSTNNATARVDYTIPADSGLTGSYFNNKTLSCSPTFTQVDGVVDSTQIAWPLTGGPGGGLGNDDFSVSWKGQIKSNYTENITLKTSSDDGVRVFFNGNLVIDKWLDRGVPVTKDTATVAMMAGTWYNIRVDYYEHGGDSIAQLFWNGATQTGGVDQIVPQQNLRQTYTETLNYGLLGNYYNSTNPLGTPAATCIDQSSYYYFDLGAPRPGMNTDNFSVSWTGKVTTNYNETVTFCTKADDGTRMWIDDNMIIDNFVPHTLQEDCGAIALTAGQHNIRVDYFDYLADSAIGIYWQGASQTGGAKIFIPLDHLTPSGYTGANYGLKGDYYSNMSLLGLPTLSRIDPNVFFDFGPLSPDGSIPNDSFSVKWTGKIIIKEAGSYNFVFYSDDGIRFRLNGNLLIDQWIDQTKTRTETGAVVLAPGSYDIEISYFEDTGMGGVFFYYDTPSSPGEVIVPMSVLTH